MERLATGAWLDRRLIRTASGFSIAATLAAIAYLLATGTGTLDAWGRPIGTDFSNVWTAGRMVLEGRAAEAYDWAAHHRVQQAVHGDPAVPFYGWHYPPPFLLLAALLATMPYLPALAVWQAGTLVPALLVLRRLHQDRDTILVALGCPAVFVCLTHGHNAFLTALLFGAGLLALERRPVLAGFCLGLLCYKPQFGLLVPLALAAGGHGRAIVAAAATVLALVLGTTALLGIEPWSAFLASTSLTRSVVLEAGDTGWAKIQSAFAAVRMWGGGVGAAYAVQGVLTALVAAGTAWLWHARAAFALRASSLLVGSLLATPYGLDYDLVLLGPAIAALAAHGLRHGFARWEASALALAWFAPIGARVAAQHLAIPLGVLSLMLLFGLVLRRGVSEPRPMVFAASRA